MKRKFFETWVYKSELLFSFTFVVVLLTILSQYDNYFVFSGLYMAGYKLLDYYWIYMPQKYRNKLLLCYSVIILFHLKWKGLILIGILIDNILSKLCISKTVGKNRGIQLVGMILAPFTVLYWPLIIFYFGYLFFYKFRNQEFSFSKAKSLPLERLPKQKDIRIITLVSFLHNFIYFLFSITMPVKVVTASKCSIYFIGVVYCLNWLLFFKKREIYAYLNRVSDYRIIGYSFALSGLTVLLLEFIQNLWILLLLVLWQGLLSGLSELFFSSKEFLKVKEQEMHIWRIGGILGCIANTLLYHCRFSPSIIAFILSILVSAILLLRNTTKNDILKIESV